MRREKNVEVYYRGSVRYTRGVQKASLGAHFRSLKIKNEKTNLRIKFILFITFLHNQHHIPAI